MKKGKNSFYAVYVKRVLDLLISLFFLIVLSPLFLLLCLFGAIAMNGNPLFLQQRPGRKDKKTGEERIFKLVKFRTMNNKKDRQGNLLPDSERLTRYGAILRKTSLDELPELVNVLLGDLSICGPRPLLIEYLPYFTPEERHRHDVRPGITGWAQVHGRNSLPWEKRFRMDVEYVENLSFGLDVKILFLTVKSVLTAGGVAENTAAAEGNFAKIRKAQRRSQRRAKIQMTEVE